MDDAEGDRLRERIAVWQRKCKGFEARIAKTNREIEVLVALVRPCRPAVWNAIRNVMAANRGVECQTQEKTESQS